MEDERGTIYGYKDIIETDANDFHVGDLDDVRTLQNKYLSIETAVMASLLLTQNSSR